MRWPILTLLAASLFTSAAWADPGIQLKSECPPSFEKAADGTCQLRTLYDFYDSPAEHGGLRAALPELPARYTPEQIDLGRYLFFDPLLSARRDVACGSCHQPSKGLADGRPQGLGAFRPDGSRAHLPRATPSLWNVAFLKRLMWDGSAHELVGQAQRPLFNADEMGNTPEQLERSVRSTAGYPPLFRQAFGDDPTVENIATALAAFQSSLISLNSRYDRYVHGDSGALSSQEVRGYNSFRGFVARCTQCHVPPLFTDSALAVIGVPNAQGQAFDPGAGRRSTDPSLLGAFKVPTLRNITRTAPYFHAGQSQSLDEAVHFYNDTRGHVAPKGVPLKLHWHIHMTRGPQLSKEDERDIVAFLGSLEDELMLPVVPKTLPSGLQPSTTLSAESP